MKNLDQIKARLNDTGYATSEEVVYDMRRLIARVERLETALEAISPEPGVGIYPASECWIVARKALAEEDGE